MIAASYQDTIEARICTNGVRAEIDDFVYEAPVERLIRWEDEHVLGMPITPQQTRPLARFAGPAASGRFVAIRRPLFLPANTPLITRVCEGRERVILLGFSSHRFDAVTGHGTDWRIDLDACLDLANEGITDNLLRLAREVAAPGFAADILIEAVGVSIMVELARHFRKRATAWREPSVGLAPRHLRRLRDYVEDAEETTPTIAALAALCGISERHLMRQFKQATGETIKSYVERVRLTRAKSLLAGTDLPLKEIAAKVGFATPSAFSVAFRRATGETPTAYRLDFRASPLPKGRRPEA